MSDIHVRMLVVKENTTTRNTKAKESTMTTFELNGKSYSTDSETLSVLRSIMPTARETGDSSAVIAVMAIGEKTGRITEL